MFNRGDRSSTPLPFVTHVELDTAVQTISAMAQQALDQSGKKTGRIDLLAAVVTDLQAQNQEQVNRFAALETRINSLESRATALEFDVLDLQEQVNALGLLIS